MRRRIVFLVPATIALLLAAGPAWACGGLVNANGSVSLVRTTTLAAYHLGVEHYVTSFEFAGVGGEFGSIVPLPGVPSKVVRAGDWTLQRLVRETQPVLRFAALASPAAEDATVLLETQIDALDVTVLKGGGTAVGNWAREHGFLLPPDAPEVLDFYANRSPIFMAVRFNGERATEQGISQGEGTPVHVVIPTTNPWVPLRILGLGAPANAPIEADVFLLTDREPALLPAPVQARSDSKIVGVAPEGSARPGLVLERSEPASASLLSDLRSDKGMQWLPASGMWLTYMRVDANAGALKYDLAVDATGAGRPSPVAAGLSPRDASALDEAATRIWPAALAALALVAGIATGAWLGRPRVRPRVG